MEQLRRSLPNCQSPTLTLSNATPAIAAHTKKMSSAHALGTVMAEPALPALDKRALDAATPRNGSAAIATKAKNHTANRVLEFRRPTSLKSTQAKSAMPAPSSTQFSKLAAEIRATSFRLNAVVILLTRSLFLLPVESVPVADAAYSTPRHRHRALPGCLK